MLKSEIFLLKKKHRKRDTGDPIEKVAGTREATTLEINSQGSQTRWTCSIDLRQRAPRIAGILFLSLHSHPCADFSSAALTRYVQLPASHRPQMPKFTANSLPWSCSPIMARGHIYRLGNIYNRLVFLQHPRMGLAGGRVSSLAFMIAVGGQRQDSGEVGVAEDGHGQQDDAVDVHHGPPQRLLGRVGQLQLHGCLLFLRHLGALLLVQAAEQVVGLPAASFFLLGGFCVGEKE